MNTEQLANPEKSKAWQIFSRFAVILALVASLATVIGLWVQLHSEKHLLEIQILSADQLTRLPSVSGLNGQFTYNDISVTDLWRLRLRFINTGDGTLIGQGLATSLLGSNITVSFPQVVRILDASPQTGSFYKITQPTPNTLGIEFSQWRRQESFELIVYFASDAVLQSPPMPSISGRPIIDGDIHVISLIANASDGPRQVIDYLPFPIALMGKILGGFFAAVIFAVSFGWLVVVSPISYIRAQLWRLKYSDLLRKYIDESNLSAKAKEGILKEPWSQFPPFFINSAVANSRRSKERSKIEGKVEADIMHEQKLAGENIMISASKNRERFWKKFQGPPPPDPNFDTFVGTFIGFLVGLTLSAASAAIVASMIIV